MDTEELDLRLNTKPVMASQQVVVTGDRMEEIPTKQESTQKGNNTIKAGERKIMATNLLSNNHFFFSMETKFTIVYLFLPRLLG